MRSPAGITRVLVIMNAPLTNVDESLPRPSLLGCVKTAGSRMKSCARRQSVPVRHGIGWACRPIKSVFTARSTTLIQRSCCESFQGATGTDCVLMLGHNPGIADVADRLVRQPPDHIRFFDYPTCATTVMAFDVKSWAEVKWRTGTVLGFTIPRDLIE